MPDSNKGGNLYVKINDTEIPYTGESSDLTRSGWNRWDIPLAELSGTDLMHVRSLTIGIEGGGSGVIYVDDIRLTPEAEG